MSTLSERLKALPAERRRKVQHRYKEMLAEEMMLADLRRSLGLTQDAMARKLRVKQPRVSKIEKRPETVLDALRAYVEALGGKLELVAVMPKGRRIRIRSPHAARAAA